MYWHLVRIDKLIFSKCVFDICKKAVHEQNKYDESHRETKHILT